MKLYRLYLNKIWQLSLIDFVLVFGIASFTTVWPVYLKKVLQNDTMVGVFSALISLASILLSLLFIPIIEKYPKVKIFSISAVGMFISLLAYSYTQNIYAVILISAIFVASMVFHQNSFGIMIRDQSSASEIGKTEGILFTLLNLSFIISPLIAGLIMSQVGLSEVFIFSAIFIFTAFIMFRIAIQIKEVPRNGELHKNLFKNLKDFFKNKELVKIYVVSMGISWWWGFIYTYPPLLILDKGLDPLLIGVFLFFIPIPLLLEFIVGKMSDNMGFRRFIFSGFVILAIASALAFFETNIYMVLAYLVLASFGAAMIEPLREAYFFKVTNQEEEEKYYGAFLTAVDSGHMLGKLLNAGILIFLPFKFIFLAIFLMMLLFAYSSLKLEK
ncbi:MFS transporter [Candidatus Azambacteria bacterium]|nr:MFS transporter [Candidatus Azambacteria bacterium]